MPAASSLALLMRRPDDRRWMEVLSEPWLTPRLRWAVSEATLVLMGGGHCKSPEKVTDWEVLC